MSVAQAVPRHAAASEDAAGRAIPLRRAPRPSRRATDDEILGLAPAGAAAPGSPEDAAQDNFDFGAGGEASASEGANGAETSPAEPSAPQQAAPESEELRAALDAHPGLRRAWQDAQSYRQTFATPEAARQAAAVLGDFDRLDALFFSRRPEDHAELARAVAQLDPAAFASLAQAMGRLTAEAQALAAAARTPAQPAAQSAPNPGAARTSLDAVAPVPQADARPAEAARPETQRAGEALAPASDIAGPGRGPTPAQAEFFRAANAAAVRNVLAAIETQVDRLLPEEISANAKNRLAGEIYRELDASLRANRQFGQQLREAFRSGALDAEHERAVVSLLTSRARQALPGVAKRVLDEWTPAVVAASQNRRARQRAAEGRVDIAGSRGSGNGARRPSSPRDIDYARMSDADILNL